MGYTCYRLNFLWLSFEIFLRDHPLATTLTDTALKATLLYFLQGRAALI